MSSATRGRSSEYKVRDDMVAAGWVFLMRAAASKGPADLLMGHPDLGAALVQVGRASKRLGPFDRNRFVGAADLIGALPLLAIVVPRAPITYWHVTYDRPGTWAAWHHEESM